jgi:putative spermidine/putrescine transport system substrate-binding protein
MQADQDRPPSLPRRAALLLGGGAALSMPAFRRLRAAETLFVNTWGGPWERAAAKHLFEPFTRETGIEIRTVSPVSFAKLAAQVRSGSYEFDVTTLGLAEIVRANQARLLESLAGLGGSRLWDGALFQNGVSSHAFATVLAWNTRKYGDAPQGWPDFWNLQRYPGTRCLQRYAARVLPIALAGDGVPTNRLYPLDIERSFRALDRIKPNIRVWWTQGQQSAQLLRDGEVDMIAIWHGRVLELIDENKPVKMTWEGGQVDRAYWVVARGTPRKDAAMRFVEAAVQPQRLAGFCQEAVYGPLNPKSFEFLNNADAARMPTSPQNYPKVFEQDIENFGGDVAQVTARFERWVGA